MKRCLKITQMGIDELELLLDWRMKVLHTVFADSKDVDWEELRDSNRFYYMEYLPKGEHVAVVAWLDGEPVGCGGVCYQPEMPSPDNPWCESAYLMNIYVEPSFRHQEIGSSIVKWLISDAHSKGVRKIYLETSECGREMYEKLGFIPMPDMLHLIPKN